MIHCLLHHRGMRLSGPFRRFWLSLSVLFLCWHAPLQAQNTSRLSCTPDWEPADGSYDFVEDEQDSALHSDGARVGQIHFTRLKIFDESDPAENNALFRWANNIHLLTREETIDQQLLIDTGMPYQPRLLEESARLLRAQSYFYDAAIRPVSECNGEVEVEVVTRDNWSLTPNIAIDRFGGETTYAIGMRDSNLLGRGRLLAIGHGKDIDQQSSELRYQDNNVFGSRVRNSTVLIDSDEGELVQFDVDLPFFSLDSRRSWAVRLKNEKRQDEQYFRGKEVSEVVHKIDDYTIEYGLSRGLEDNVANRWRIGLQYQNNHFLRSADLPPPSRFPDDKRLVYPYLSYESVEDDFATAFNLDQIHRTEDLQLGRHWSVALGFAGTAFGSDSDRWVLKGSFEDTLNFDGDSLWQHSLSLEGMWNLDRGEAEDTLLSYENRYFRRQTPTRAFHARFEAQYSVNLNSHRQVVLGGFTGTRAFENEFQAGDRRVLLTLEERLYTDIHLFNLLRLGGAVFMDVGRAWEPGVNDGLEDDWLADVGFGLRLASSKAASDRIAHLDFAFPLTNQNDPSVDKVLIAFTVKGHF